MKPTKKTFATLGTATFFALAACSVEDGEDFTNISASSNDSEEELSLEEAELAYNYQLLYYYYINASEELGDYEDYLGYGQKNGFAQGKYLFPDVAYMYSSMSDNYTYYLDPVQYVAWALSEYSSDYSMGIGAFAETAFAEDSSISFVITNVYKESPANKAGIEIGDTVKAIDGTVPSSLTTFDKLASGEYGDTLEFEIARPSGDTLVKVVIDYYFIPTVELSFMDSIPIIKISSFEDSTISAYGTYGEFIDALEETADAKATIIDLRGNLGGSIDQCLDIASEFLDKNDTIALLVTNQYDEDIGGYIDSTIYYSSENGIAKDRYFVFLANEMTASCAETLILAVASNKRTPIVGKTTYGKGIGQFTYTTYAGGFFSITAMKIYDKDKGSCHKYGIVPSYELDDDESLEKAVELSKSRTEFFDLEYGKTNTGHFAKAHETLTDGVERMRKGGAYKRMELKAPGFTESSK